MVYDSESAYLNPKQRPKSAAPGVNLAYAKTQAASKDIYSETESEADYYKRKDQEREHMQRLKERESKCTGARLSLTMPRIAFVINGCSPIGSSKVSLKSLLPC